jgi:hypothetical protein
MIRECRSKWSEKDQEGGTTKGRAGETKEEEDKKEDDESTSSESGN